MSGLDAPGGGLPDPSPRAGEVPLVTSLRALERATPPQAAALARQLGVDPRSDALHAALRAEIEAGRPVSRRPPEATAWFNHLGAEGDPGDSSPRPLVRLRPQSVDDLARSLSAVLAELGPAEVTARAVGSGSSSSLVARPGRVVSTCGPSRRRLARRTSRVPTESCVRARPSPANAPSAPRRARTGPGGSSDAGHPRGSDRHRTPRCRSGSPAHGRGDRARGDARRRLGREPTLTRIEPDDPDRFDAVRVGLGALGVVTAVELRVGPALRFAQETVLESATAALDRCDAAIANDGDPHRSSCESYPIRTSTQPSARRPCSHPT